MSPTTLKSQAEADIAIRVRATVVEVAVEWAATIPIAATVGNAFGPIPKGFAKLLTWQPVYIIVAELAFG